MAFENDFKKKVSMKRWSAKLQVGSSRQQTNRGLIDDQRIESGDGTTPGAVDLQIVATGSGFGPLLRQGVHLCRQHNRHRGAAAGAPRKEARKGGSHGRFRMGLVMPWARTQAPFVGRLKHILNHVCEAPMVFWGTEKRPMICQQKT